MDSQDTCFLLKLILYLNYKLKGLLYEVTTIIKSDKKSNR